MATMDLERKASPEHYDEVLATVKSGIWTRELEEVICMHLFEDFVKLIS